MYCTKILLVTKSSTAFYCSLIISCSCCPSSYFCVLFSFSFNSETDESDKSKEDKAVEHRVSTFIDNRDHDA